MKWIFLFLLFVLPSWVCAADGDAQNALAELTEGESIQFAQAICDSSIAQKDSCEYYKNYNGNRLLLNFTMGEFSLNSVVYGRFTSPNSEEAFVNLGVTETESSLSSAFFRYQNNQWYLIDFNRDNGAYYCSKFHNSSLQDFLVCGSTGLDFGFDFGTHKDDANIYAEYNGFFDLETFRFDNDVITPDYLFSIVNPFYVFCDEINQERSGKDYFGDFSWSCTDTNNDLNPDLLLDFSQAKIDMSTCFNSGKGFSNPAAIHPVQLIWLFDGETVTPTPETKVFLDELEAEQ